MVTKECSEKLKIHEKEVEAIEKSLEKYHVSSISESFPKRFLPRKDDVYDGELHSLFIKKVMEIFNDLKIIDPFDIKTIGDYTSLLEHLIVVLEQYLSGCFTACQSMWDEQVPEKRLKSLLIQLKKLSNDLENTANEDEKIVLEQKKCQLLEYLCAHKARFFKKCSTFELADQKIISSMIEIINNYENDNYGLFDYTTVSDAYDAHGKSDDIYFHVFHPVTVNYRRYYYGKPSKLTAILKLEGHDYIVGPDYNSDHFKSLPYLNYFLDRLAKWRFEQYFLKKSPADQAIDKFSIPDEVLVAITEEFIQSKKETAKKLVKSIDDIETSE